MTNGSTASTDWIAVDWGTSNLRVWAIDEAGEILAATGSDRGMGQLSPDDFEPVLLDLIAPYMRPDSITRVICCGMVGAKQGWCEAAYQMVPCAARSGDACVTAPAVDPRLDVRILPGVKQDDPADVMRGEEVQIAGFLRDTPGFEGTICLPGTHTKWVQVRDGAITGFKTCMTGELFALLSGASVLRHSVDTSDWDEGAFTAELRRSVDCPSEAVGRLFPLRAESLLAGLPPSRARARLSGLLIGQELATTVRYWRDQPIVLIGAGKLIALYAAALATQSVTVRQVDGDTATLAGLTAAHDTLKEQT